MLSFGLVLLSNEHQSYKLQILRSFMFSLSINKDLTWIAEIDDSLQNIKRNREFLGPESQ